MKEYSIGEVLDYLDRFAPRETAEKWDHVGLMVGDRNFLISGVVLALDPSGAALSQCIQENANLLITHHPLFFEPCTSIDYTTQKGALVRDIIRNGLTVYSAHTNLDKAVGGVDDSLADVLGLIPIGTDEFSRIIHRQFETTLSYFEAARMTREKLGASGVILNSSVNSEIGDVFISSGAFDSELIPLLIGSGISLVITGEIKHHHMVALKEAGILVIAAGHESTETPVFFSLEKRLEEAFPELKISVCPGNVFQKAF